MDANGWTEAARLLSRLAQRTTDVLDRDVMKSVLQPARQFADVALRPPPMGYVNPELELATAAVSRIVGSEGRVTPAVVRARIRQLLSVAEMVAVDGGLPPGEMMESWAESSALLCEHLAALSEQPIG